MTLRIRNLVALTGIQAATLRVWERRYGFPRPERGTNNYRTYSHDEAAAVRRVASLLKQGYATSEAIRTVLSTPMEAVPVKERVENRFWSAVVAKDEAAGSAALDEAQALMSPAELVDELLLPLVRKPVQGLDLAANLLARTLVRQRLKSLMEQKPRSSAGPVALLARAPGDPGEEEQWALAVHLRRAGWQPVLLSDTPSAAALVNAALQVRPHIVTLTVVGYQNRAEFQRLLTDVCASVSAPLVVSGPGALPYFADLQVLGVSFAGSEAELRMIGRRLNLPGA